ncbi:hypothetical protein ACFVTE_09350 [Arthrobacter sp. NPDC058097]|uniref:hypothetical protein n=1 Tax=Arthrobacter sp. NPDC058097 TaxID=3346340 RepID=UPI0036DCCFC4
MRRKYLLSVAMLSVLLATSACEAGSSASVASPHSERLTGSGTGDGSTSQPEIGISQWNAAQAAKVAKTKPAAAAKAGSSAKTMPAAAAKAKSAAKTKPAATAEATAAAKAAATKAAAKAAAAENAAATAAKTEAAAKKEAAAKEKAARDAAKTRPATGSLKQVTPLPVTPKTAPEPVRQGSAEQPAEEIVRSACETADTLHDNTLDGSATIGVPGLPITVGGTGTDAGTMDKFRCLD